MSCLRKDNLSILKELFLHIPALSYRKNLLRHKWMFNIGKRHALRV